MTVVYKGKRRTTVVENVTKSKFSSNAGDKVKLCSHCRQSLRKLSVELYDLTVLLLGIYPKELETGTQTLGHQCSVVLLTVPKR